MSLVTRKAAFGTLRRCRRFMVASAAAMLVPVAADAGTIVCSGSVQRLAYHQSGNVMLQLSGMNVPVLICNFDSDWVVAGTLAGNTSPASCKALYASFLTAKMSGTPIFSLYLDGNQVPADCSAFAPFTPVNVRYFEHQ